MPTSLKLVTLTPESLTSQNRALASVVPPFERSVAPLPLRVRLRRWANLKARSIRYTPPALNTTVAPLGTRPMNAIRAALASAEPVELMDAGTGIPAGTFAFGLAFGLAVAAGLTAGRGVLRGAVWAWATGRGLGDAVGLARARSGNSEVAGTMDAPDESSAVKVLVGSAWERSGATRPTPPRKLGAGPPAHTMPAATRATIGGMSQPARRAWARPRFQARCLGMAGDEGEGVDEVCPHWGILKSANGAPFYQDVARKRERAMGGAGHRRVGRSTDAAPCRAGR